MQYELEIFGYNRYGKTHLATASYNYETGQSLIEIVKENPDSWYRSASRKSFPVTQMYLRGQRAIKRIATVDSEKYEYRYIYDTGTFDEVLPVACVVLDTETNWFGASFVNPTSEYRTEMKEFKTPKGTILREQRIRERDTFQYTIARERAVENIGRLVIPNRVVEIGSHKEKLSTIVNDIMNDWDLA